MIDDSRLSESFWARVSPEPNSGCWLWTGSWNSAGYGRVKLAGRDNLRAHRITYTTLVGPVPPGLELDHLCRVRCCCNPAHLEPVTHRENLIRGIGPKLTKESRAAITHCPYGHEYTVANTRNAINSRSGYPNRLCRACGNARSKACLAKRKLQRTCTL